METDVIKAIGQLSVEVVAIIALAGSLFFTAKASLFQAKEMKNLTAAINKFVQNGVNHNDKMTEAVVEIKAMTTQNVKLVQQHHFWATKLAKSLEKTT